MADGTSAEQKREAVATRAGLSALHGGTEKAKVTWRGACDSEPDMFIAVERQVDAETARTVTDLPIECPVCGNEHLLAQVT